jgi:glutamate--cysteine ligase
MDLDPFEPLGIAAQTMQFLDVFLLHCLLSESADDTPQETAELARNQHRTASAGREPGLMLERQGQPVALVGWGQEILAGCVPIAAHLDRAQGGDLHVAALRAASARLAALDSTPSARVLATMHADFGDSFAAFINAQSAQTRKALLDLPFDAALAERFERAARESLAEQRRREQADELGFEAYRQQYLAPEHLLA